MCLLSWGDNERQRKAGTLLGGQDKRVLDGGSGSEESLQVARRPDCRMFRVASDDARSRLEVSQHVDQGPIEKVVRQGRESRQEFRPAQDDEVDKLVRNEADIGNGPAAVDETERGIRKVDRSDDPLSREGEHFQGGKDRMHVALGVVQEV